VSDIRFTKNICATLGTTYDVLKGRNDEFYRNFFNRQERFILNYKYNPLIGYFGNTKLEDFFLPAIHHQDSSLAGKNINNKLYKEIEKINETNEELTQEHLKTLINQDERNYSIIQIWLSEQNED
jgi:hypothetical protein